MTDEEIRGFDCTGSAVCGMRKKMPDNIPSRPDTELLRILSDR